MAKRKRTYVEVVELVQRAARTVSDICAVVIHLWGRRPKNYLLRRNPPSKVDGSSGN